MKSKNISNAKICHITNLVLILFKVLFDIKFFLFFRKQNYEVLIADDGISGEKSVSVRGNLRPINDPITMSI